MNTDRIGKKILLRASRERVWRALSDSAEFGAWFGMKFDGPFPPGASMRGVITPTTVDAGIAKATLVVFGLEEAADSVMLTVTESGFERIPLLRRPSPPTSGAGVW